MLRIAPSASSYIQSQPATAQKEILNALEVIESDPVRAGIHLPFPYQSGTLGYATTRYWVTYRVVNGIAEVGGVTRLPTSRDILAVIQPRRRR